MKKVAIGLSVIALLFVFAGCPGMKDTGELEAKVEQQQQQITELEGQVETLTAERDSLLKVIGEDDGGNGSGSKPPREGQGSGGSSGGGSGTPGKPPRTGR